MLDSKWPHAWKKKPGHDDEVDEEDDGGDEGEDTERQDGTILHLEWYSAWGSESYTFL